MQFSDFESLYEISRKEFGVRKSFLAFYTAILNDPMIPEVYAIRAAQETLWYCERRPFYKVWPSIIPPLIRTSLELKLTDLQLTNRAYLIQLPVPRGSVLVTTSPKPILSITVQHAHRESASVKLDSITQTIEKQVDEHPDFTPMLRLAVAVIMLDNDPTIIEPIVLSKDRNKPRDIKHIEKARRRGLVGWEIGRQVEVMPHIRRPHFAIRWTGSGRTIPKLTAIKGSVIHKATITTVPTGHLDHDATKSSM